MLIGRDIFPPLKQRVYDRSLTLEEQRVEGAGDTGYSLDSETGQATFSIFVGKRAFFSIFCVK